MDEHLKRLSRNESIALIKGMTQRKFCETAEEALQGLKILSQTGIGEPKKLIDHFEMTARDEEWLRETLEGITFAPIFVDKIEEEWDWRRKLPPKIFVEVPTTPPDFRQTALRKAFPVIREKLEGEGYDTSSIDTGGWPASCVNLGWLGDQIRQFWKDSECRCPYYVAHCIEEEISSVVSRFKRWDGIKIVQSLSGWSVSIKFGAKDDNGWYDYGFTVFLKEKD